MLCYPYYQWRRSLLSIVGVNLQFYYNFALYSTLGGMNLDHDFVQVWKFSEDQKKNANKTLFLPEFRWRPKKKVFINNRTLFSLILGEDQKKRVFSKNRTLFSPNLRSAVHPFKLLGGCRCGPFSNYWGDTAKLLGNIFPPGFGTPAYYDILTSSACWSILSQLCHMPSVTLY